MRRVSEVLTILPEAKRRFEYLNRAIGQLDSDRAPAPPVEVQHGTINAYTYHSCRCDLCREANRKHAAEYRARAKSWPNCSHGKPSTYQAGCRCALCRKAASRKRGEYLRAQRAKERRKRQREAQRAEYFRLRHLAKKGL